MSFHHHEQVTPLSPTMATMRTQELPGQARMATNNKGTACCAASTIGRSWMESHDYPQDCDEALRAFSTVMVAGSGPTGTASSGTRLA